MSARQKKAKPKAKKAATKKPPAPKVSKTKKAAKAVAVEEKPKKAAPKPKKPAEKKEAPAKVSVRAEQMELGPPPEATVASRHIDSMHERPARGFSFGELASAGVPLNAAKREGLSLDVRRRSVVEGNVEALKGWFKSPRGSSSETTAEAVAVATAGKKK
jgi:ribosomal protein L13E